MSQSLVIITPVGPRHSQWVPCCTDSVTKALEGSQGYFDKVAHVVVDDQQGRGRSLVRNDAIAEHEYADWYFFLDADDEMNTTALYDFERLVTEEHDALIGAAGGYTKGNLSVHHFTNVYPKTFGEVRELKDARGLFAMTGFFRGDCVREIYFNEDNDTSESFEFMMEFTSKFKWEKVPELFTLIHCDRPSAVGPRGYESLQWLQTCQPILEAWK